MILGTDYTDKFIFFFPCNPCLSYILLYFYTPVLVSKHRCFDLKHDDSFSKHRCFENGRIMF